jgi:hypothetical protein
MYRLIQKYGKVLLAVFSAVLMVTFMLPAATRYGGSRNPVVGRLADGEKLHSIEAYNATQAWELLNRLRDPQDPQGRPVSLLLGPTAFQQIHEHPVMFLLLQKEADRMGISVSNDQIQTAIANTPWLNTSNPDQNESIQRAIAQLMLVRQAYNRAASAIKVSEPMLKHDLATMGQTITLSAIDFTTAKYRDKVPAPNADQIKKQFEQFADTVRGQVTDANPFGFGYKYPDRVKLQYIAIPRAEVRRAVEASKDAYTWEVESNKYYLQHPNEFANAPTSKPANFSLDAPASQPAIKPFAQVKDQIKNRLIDQEVTRKAQQVQERITSQLAADWTAYRAAAGTATQPTTAPSTSLGVPYNSFDYLKKLQESVQKQTGVLPTVMNVGDNWQTQDDLAKLQGIGTATITSAARPMTMPVYVTMLTAPFLNAENRSQTGVLQLMEPTRPMNDSAETVYIARVTAAETAHKPASLAEVEKQVVDDVKTKLAYEQAKADAQKLLDQARQQGDLNKAAGGQGVIKVGPLTNRQDQPIPALVLTGDASTRFTEQAFKLLSAPPTTAPSAQAAASTAPTTGSVASSTTKPAGPARIGLVELPHEGRVLVAQLGDVQAMWNDRTLPMEQAQLAAMMKQEDESRFNREWFTWEAVTSRLGYVEEAGQQHSRDGGAPSAPPPPQAPIF